MELRLGYKRTNVGIIPDDWSAPELGKLLLLTSGESPSRFAFKPGGTPYFKVEQLGSSEKYLGRHCTPYQINSERSVPAGSILIAKRGAAIALNRVRILAEPAFMDTNLMALTPTGGLESEYLFYALTHIGLWQFADTTSVPQINNKHIRPLRVPLPPPLEQRAIADALAHVDAVLSGLDRLIAKKRDLKQAAMQQLLTGQTRLPGFGGEWETKRLGDHARFLRHGVNSRAELTPEGSVKYLHYGDVHACTDVRLDPAHLPALPARKAISLDRLQDGDLVIADASEDTVGISKSVELANVGEREVVAGLHTIAVRFDKSILANGFKGYLQHCPAFSSHLRRLAAGTKVYATNRAHVASVEMRLPSTDEQSAIAAILSDMDAEIAALENRRDKTKAIKQGMMQELLTGKIRLIAPAEVAHA